MTQIENIAVFVDIENVINFCTALNIPIDLSAILDKLHEEGRIVIRRSFGDINKTLSATRQFRETDRVRKMLRDNLFIHQDIVYTSTFKNSADMSLAVDALTTAFTMPNITKFAVISGDSDYVPLFQKLQEHSRTVIGITGTRDRTAVIYRNSCDSLYYFDDLYRASIASLEDDEEETNSETEQPQMIPAVAAVPVTITEAEAEKPAETLEKGSKPVRSETGTELKSEIAAGTNQLPDSQVPSKAVEQTTESHSESASAAPPPPTASVFDLQTIRDEYAGLLISAVRILDQSGKQSQMNTLIPQMRQLQPDFDFERADFTSFMSLVNFAKERGLVRVQQKGENVFVSLPQGESPARREISTAEYRQYLQDRLKCKLPSYSMRIKICEEAFNHIGFNQSDGGILLSHLSNDVTDELAIKNFNIAQPEVYKYLYSLFRARCFEIERREPSDYNPKILGFNAQKEQWDDRFVSAQIRAMSEQGKLKMFPEKLSQLFYETPGKTMHVKQLLNGLNIEFEVNH